MDVISGEFGEELVLYSLWCISALNSLLFVGIFGYVVYALPEA